MKVFLTILLLSGIFSCTTNTPEPQSGVILPDVPSVDRQESANPAPGPASPKVINGEAVFDPSAISHEEFENAKSEIQFLVEDLNRVIRVRDYTAWLSYLSDDFIATINSPEYLDWISKSSRQLTMQHIVLKTPRDYFTHVVVAARKNVTVDAQLDDIEFLSHNRVKAFSLVRNQRLRLYEFVRSGGTWKLSLSS
jgi:hypothetical protein